VDEDIARRVRVAGRALARAGLVHAYGHCSARLDQDRFLVSPARPLGLIAPNEGCIEVTVDRPLPSGSAGEVRIHQAIYQARPDVGGICRAQAPHTMTLSVARMTPRARHGFSSHFAPQPALWDDPALVRDDTAAAALAKVLGPGSAIVMRGNGAVTVGSTIEEATVLSWYLEDSARVELALHQMKAGSGTITELSPAEAERRATWTGGLLERMWTFLTDGDPELDSSR
jgi:HCOMODA/2-hydroxy-3-carboxy-muconic semialdehyde decarboxylase